ncbi:MAG: acyl-CoA desaturase [Actinobacteria bacterium]|nr:acyl-CoA desaturase [Actinomycetota bacterium]
MKAAGTTATPRRVPGVELLSQGGHKVQRFTVLILTVLPLLGLTVAIATLWGRGLGLLEASLFVSFYFFTGFGVTIGFHRMLTHQSFKARPVTRAVLAIAGSMSLQGSVISWVATHRRHHAFSDQAGDPHSPHVESEEGIKGILKGLWHAHLGWLFDPEQTSPERWAPDLLKDPVMVKINRWFPALGILSFALPPMIAFVITRSYAAALMTFLWASLARIFLLHHVTWSINSICHFYGKRPFESPDHSTNNWMLSILSMGESWHNNHHAFPTSARHGILRGQIDPSALVIRLLEKLGLVEDVKAPSSAQLESRKAA